MYYFCVSNIILADPLEPTKTNSLSKYFTLKLLLDSFYQKKCIHKKKNNNKKKYHFKIPICSEYKIQKYDSRHLYHLVKIKTHNI